MSDELRERLALVSSTWTPQQRLHVGNVAWAHSRGDGSPEPNCTLRWGGPMQAFADVWDDEVSLHVSPLLDGAVLNVVLDDLLAVAPALSLEVSHQDDLLVAALTARGFREVDGPWFAVLHRTLEIVDPWALPEGYRIVEVDDVAGRVDVHRRAWAPARIKGLLGLEFTGTEPGSSYSLDKHRAAMATPVYRRDLDLVAVASDGTVAAYALGWLDAVNGSVLFEPVGTDPLHAGKGLARSLCTEVLRRARALGATQAVVAPRGDDAYPLPRRVYEALGMREVAQLMTFTTR